MTAKSKFYESTGFKAWSLATIIGIIIWTIYCLCIFNYSNNEISQLKLVYKFVIGAYLFIPFVIILGLLINMRLRHSG